MRHRENVNNAKHWGPRNFRPAVKAQDWRCIQGWDACACCVMVVVSRRKKTCIGVVLAGRRCAKLPGFVGKEIVPFLLSTTTVQPLPRKVLVVGTQPYTPNPFPPGLAFDVPLTSCTTYDSSGVHIPNCCLVGFPSLSICLSVYLPSWARRRSLPMLSPRPSCLCSLYMTILHPTPAYFNHVEIVINEWCAHVGVDVNTASLFTSLKLSLHLSSHLSSSLSSHLSSPLFISVFTSLFLSIHLSSRRTPRGHTPSSAW